MINLSEKVRYETVKENKPLVALPPTWVSQLVGHPACQSGYSLAIRRLLRLSLQYIFGRIANRFFRERKSLVPGLSHTHRRFAIILVCQN